MATACKLALGACLLGQSAPAALGQGGGCVGGVCQDASGLSSSLLQVKRSVLTGQEPGSEEEHWAIWDASPGRSQATKISSVDLEEARRADRAANIVFGDDKPTQRGARWALRAVAAGIAFLAGVTALREALLCCSVEALLCCNVRRGTREPQRRLLQAACVCKSFLESIEYTFLVPVSYDLASAQGRGAAMSGLLVGINGVGYVAGSILGRILWGALGHGSVRRVVVFCPVAIAGIYVAFGVLASADGGQSNKVLAMLCLRAAAGFFVGLVQLLEYMVKDTTPPEEQVSFALMNYAAFCLGAGAGPVLNSSVTYAVKRGGAPSDISAAPFLAVAFFAASTAAVLCELLPQRWSKLELDNAEVIVSSGHRGIAVTLCAAIIFLALAGAVAIEVTTALILELEGGWGSESIGFGIGGALSVAAIGSIAQMTLREYQLVQDAFAVVADLVVALFGSTLLFRWPWDTVWQVLLADLLMYPCIASLSSVAQGIAFTLVASDSFFSMPNLTVAVYVMAGVARATLAPLVRYLISIGGRAAYGAVMLSMGLLMALAWGAIWHLAPEAFQGKAGPNAKSTGEVGQRRGAR